MYIIAGLGNPGEEYEKTRHNVGRLCLEYIKKNKKFGDWLEDKKNKSLVLKGLIEDTKVTFVEPEAYMNKSGPCLKGFVSDKKKAEKLIVIYDDLDLAIGSVKVSFNKNSGGHRGLESIMKSLGTKSFIRIRVGISPETPSGKLKKPKGEEKVKDFILGEFTKNEKDKLSKSFKSIERVIGNIVLYGREKAVSLGI